MPVSAVDARHAIPTAIASKGFRLTGPRRAVVDASKGTQRFELAEQFTGHHHHLVCQECGGVEDLDGCLLEDEVLDAIRQRVWRSRNFRLTGHDLKLFGLCRRCDAR